MYPSDVGLIKDLIASEKRLAVIFYRPSCPYCQYLLPLFDAMQINYPMITFKAVNIDNHGDEFKEAFGFSSVPTVIYFKDGTEINRHGSNNMSITQEEMEAILDELK